MSAAPVTDIYLVRHGETDWNRDQRLQGTIDTPLNRIGLAQAHQIADRFRALTGMGASPVTHWAPTPCCAKRSCWWRRSRSHDRASFAEFDVPNPLGQTRRR
jgi:hypothetical protein